MKATMATCITLSLLPVFMWIHACTISWVQRMQMACFHVTSLYLNASKIRLRVKYNSQNNKTLPICIVVCRLPGDLLCYEHSVFWAHYAMLRDVHARSLGRMRSKYRQNIWAMFCCVNYRTMVILCPSLRMDVTLSPETVKGVFKVPALWSDITRR